MSARGFPEAEFRARVAAAQARMAKAGLGALLLTTEPEVRYFTGFLTRFWESPARPWFVVVPASGDPIAVIPAIGAALMAQTWIVDIRTWRSPDYEDDGVGLLAEALKGFSAVALPDGPETHVRIPMSDFNRLELHLGGRLCGGCSGLRANHSDDPGLASELKRLMKREPSATRVSPCASVALGWMTPISEPRPDRGIISTFHDVCRHKICMSDGRSSRGLYFWRHTRSFSSFSAAF